MPPVSKPDRFRIQGLSHLQFVRDWPAHVPHKYQSATPFSRRVIIACHEILTSAKGNGNSRQKFRANLLQTNCIRLVLSTCFFPQLKLFNDSLSKSRFHNKCSFKGYRCRASKILYLGSCLSTKDIQRLRTNKRGSHFRKRASAAFSKESETPCSSTNILLC
jgi:hypothetical protein